MSECQYPVYTYSSGTIYFAKKRIIVYILPVMSYQDGHWPNLCLGLLVKPGKLRRWNVCRTLSMTTTIRYIFVILRTLVINVQYFFFFWWSHSAPLYNSIFDHWLGIGIQHLTFLQNWYLAGVQKIMPKVIVQSFCCLHYFQFFCWPHSKITCKLADQNNAQPWSNIVCFVYIYDNISHKLGKRNEKINK